MKMKKNSIVLAIIVLVMAVILSGCGNAKESKSLDEQIIGSWEISDITNGFCSELNFYDDNTADWGSSNDANFASWVIVNDDILKFTYNDTLTSDCSGAEKWTISIDGDIMMLTNDDGVVAEYSRK